MIGSSLTSSLRKHIVIFMSLTALLLSVNAVAKPQQNQAEHIDVWVISASNEGGKPGQGLGQWPSTTKIKTDPELRSFRADFRSLPFNQYKLLKKKGLSLTPTQKGQVSFAGIKSKKQSLWVKRLPATSGKSSNKVRLEISIPAIEFKTVVSIKHGSVMMLGGPKAEKGTLIFALKAL